jgi:hypothetical protein
MSAGFLGRPFSQYPTEDHRAAVKIVGDNATPTGRIRLYSPGTLKESTTRLQSEWVGTLGHTWIDVPLVNNAKAVNTLISGTADPSQPT